MRRFYVKLDPVGSFSEVFGYMTKRRPHRWGFLGLSAALTGFIVWGLSHDSRAERPYKANIIYVQSWPADRTDAEIIAQQKIDQKKKEAEEAKVKARNEKVRKEYQKINDALKSWGL